jgi:NADH:ubiquinone oxidoreductase subunit C
MTSEQLTAFATTLVPDLKPGLSKQFPEFIITPDRIHALAKAFKEDTGVKMDYLFCETAVDRKDGFHVVYHLTSSVFRHSVILRVILTDKINPAVPTVSDVWKAAEYYEREIFDLFGIHFDHHPDMRRLFLEDDWVGYPLRKDYKDEFTVSS